MNFHTVRAQLRRGDVLIVTRLDRLARSVSQASGMITDMIDEGITINVLNLGILSNDSVNTLLRNVLLSFAQFERDMIVQRTQEGKAVARAFVRTERGSQSIERSSSMIAPTATSSHIHTFFQIPLILLYELISSERFGAAIKPVA